MPTYPTYKLGDILSYEQPTNYIVESTEYDNSYPTPVLTAGKSFILGYTNETKGVYNKLPVIIFDDFTTASQFVDFKFKVKSSAMKILSCNEEIADIKYMYYLMQITHIQSDTHKRYWISDYSKIPVSLPPLPTQQAIVARIEALFAELDKAAEHLRTAQQQLKTYRQAVLNHWLNNEDGKWEMVKIESVADVVSGYAFKSNLFKDSGKYQIIRIGNIRPGVIRIKESPVYYDEIPSGTCSKVLLKKKDVVITLTGTRKKRDYGYTAMVTQENLLLNQRLAYFRFDNKQYDPAFFLYYSWTDSFKDGFFSYETGNVGQGNVGIKAITKTEIPRPPLPDQHRIVQEIESRLSQVEAAEASIAEALQKTEALRQSILKKAFSGELNL